MRIISTALFFVLTFLYINQSYANSWNPVERPKKGDLIKLWITDAGARGDKCKLEYKEVFSKFIDIINHDNIYKYWNDGRPEGLTLEVDVSTNSYPSDGSCIGAVGVTLLNYEYPGIKLGRSFIYSDLGTQILFGQNSVELSEKIGGYIRGAMLFVKHNEMTE